MENKGLTFLEKVQNKIKENENNHESIKENLINKINKISTEILNNKNAMDYLCRVNDDIFYGFSDCNLINHLKKYITFDIIFLNKIIKQEENLERHTIQELNDILSNIFNVKILLTKYLPINDIICDFFKGLDILYNEKIISDCEMEEIFNKINNNQYLLLEGYSLLIKNRKLLILDKKTNNYFNFFLNYDMIFKISGEGFHFVNEMEKYIEDNFL